MVDALKYAVQGFQWACNETAKQWHRIDDMAAPATRETSYNLKATTFDICSLTIVSVVALQILGIGNPFVTLFIVGVGLLGREISKQAMMGTVERTAYSVFSSFIPESGRALTAGDVILLYDFTPSVRTLLS